MSRHLFAIALLLLLPFGVGTAWAVNGLHGTAEWHLGSYTAKSGGHQVASGEHLSQQYSLYYEQAGKWLDGRAGLYQFNLGAEWTSLDAKLNAATFDVSTTKLLYRGMVHFTPGGLPLRLRLYSLDMRPTVLSGGGEGDGTIEQDIEINRHSQIVGPNTLTDISNGSHVRTGATLLVGISNGNYLGHYRDLLAQVPRLLIDYQQEDVRDDKGTNALHFRDRNLAFVSLNKKNNWFHYRHRDFTDFLDEKNYIVEKTYMLGTIDHNLARKWVNFTNWVTVSADGSFNTYALPNANFSAERRYDYNIFSVGRRPNWQFSNLNSYRRLSDDNKLNKSLNLPLFVSGRVDRDTSWHLRLLTSWQERELRLEGQHSRNEVIALSGRLEKYQQRPYIMVTQLDTELKQGTTGEVQSVKAMVELSSNRRHQPRYDVAGAFTLLYLTGTSRSGSEVDYVEGQLQGKIATNLHRSLRVGLEQLLVQGQGENGSGVSNTLQPAIGGTEPGTISVGAAEQGRSVRYTSLLFAEHSTKSRLRNRLQLRYELLTGDRPEQDTMILEHTLHYNRQSWRATMRNHYVKGENLHNSTISWHPSRAWGHHAGFDYNRREVVEGGSLTQARFNQGFSYTLFTANGLIRKLGEITEDLTYEQVAANDMDTRSAVSLTLGGSWLPSQAAIYRLRAKYRVYGDDSFDELAVYFDVAYNFSLLQLAFDYTYAQRAATDLVAARDEHLWEVKVRKSF